MCRTTHRPRAFAPHASIFGKTYGKLGLIECVTGPNEEGPRYLPLRRDTAGHTSISPVRVRRVPFTNLVTTDQGGFRHLVPGATEE